MIKFNINDEVTNKDIEIKGAENELISADKDYMNSILEAFPDPFVTTDENGGIIDMNTKFKRQLDTNNIGMIKNALHILPVFNLFYEDGLEINLYNFSLYKSLYYGTIIENEIVMSKLKDKKLYFEISTRPILKAGKIKGASVILKNITEEYEELERKTHFMYLEGLINNLTEGIVVLDKNCKITLLNNFIYKIIGTRPNDKFNYETITKKYIFSNVVNDSEGANQLRKKYFEKGVPVKNKILILKNKETNETKFFELNSNPIFDSNQELVNTIITVKDVTEQRMHQILAQDRANYIKDVVNILDVPIGVVDYPSMKIKLLNKKYVEILSCYNQKFSSENIIGTSIKDFIKKPVANRIFRAIKLSGDKGKEAILSPIEIKDCRGDIRYFKYKFIPYKIKNKVKRIHIHGYDITEELKHSLELEKINILKDDFFTIISHELRTPLTIIFASIQLVYTANESEITPNIDKTLKRIYHNCSRLLKLINNVLDISKAEAGFLSLVNSNFDIVELTERLVNSIISYAVNKKITLIFDTSIEELQINMDIEKYEKILMNFISNAIKFTPENKQILVSIDNDEEFVYVSVKDEGVGIPGDKLTSIFDRFAQINASLTRRAEGAGIGLSLVKKLVELMEGEITVKSCVGAGTEFKVKFKKSNMKLNEKENLNILNSNFLDRITIEFSDLN